MAERAAEPRRAKREAEQPGPRQHRGEQRAQQPVRPWPRIGLCDVAPGVIDQVHVVHARRAGGHAGEAGQAAVDVGDHARGRRPGVLQHVLDQVDAAARAVELVPQQHVRRTGRGAEAAVHAGAQDLLRFPGVGIGQLAERERGLHGSGSAPAPGRLARSQPAPRGSVATLREKLGAPDPRTHETWRSIIRRDCACGGIGAGAPPDAFSKALSRTPVERQGWVNGRLL